MPSCTNPTGIVMSLERRKAISRLIKAHNMVLIEDDTYGFIAEDTALPMITMIPENTIYLHGISKSLSAGLRVAYLVFPHRLQKTFWNTANNINLKIPLLNAEIASELIESGAAREIIHKKCILAEERNRLYAAYFPEQLSANPYIFFQWLPLPEGCSGYHFELQAKSRGVKVLCSDRFGVGNTAQFAAIRLATCSPRTMAELESGLQIIQALVKENRSATRQEEFII